jgi:hypothetical protein
VEGLSRVDAEGLEEPSPITSIVAEEASVASLIHGIELKAGNVQRSFRFFKALNF